VMSVTGSPRATMTRGAMRVRRAAACVVFFLALVFTFEQSLRG